jgi:hypothetical protein
MITFNRVPANITIDEIATRHELMPKYDCYWMNIKSRLGYVCKISGNSFEDCYQKLMFAITKKTNNLKDGYAIFGIHLDVDENTQKTQEDNSSGITQEGILFQRYRDYYDKWIAKTINE